MTAVASSGGKRRRQAMWGQENRRQSIERQRSERSERLLRFTRAQSGFAPVGMALISATAQTRAGCWRRSRMAGSQVASNKTLNAKNLAALGTARLAELLIE